MDEIAWSLLVAACAMFVMGLVRRWYRRRVAARLADRMLDDVIKGKDAFRRRQ